MEPAGRPRDPNLVGQEVGHREQAPVGEVDEHVDGVSRQEVEPALEGRRHAGLAKANVSAVKHPHLHTYDEVVIL